MEFFSFHDLINDLEFQKNIKGLNPYIWICIEQGFLSREEIKEFLLKQGIGFVSWAVLSREELCILLLTHVYGKSKISSDYVLGSGSRQEVLRTLFSQKRISENFFHLKTLKKHPQFFQKLDAAMQAGRKVFAHTEEENAIEQRLSTYSVQNPCRKEMQLLALAYEAWLSAMSLWDPLTLLKEVVLKLDDHCFDDFLFPKAIYLFSLNSHESLEQEFWRLLEKRVKIYKIKINTAMSLCWDWERFHTLDDSAEFLAQKLASDTSELSNQAIFIPDVPAIRISMLRGLERNKVPVIDSRNPMILKTSESIKKALLPFRLIASQFDRETVFSYCKEYPELYTFEILNEINSRGIKKGLKYYAGGKLDNLYSFLLSIHNQFSGKKSCSEIAFSHLDYLSNKRFDSKTYDFFESIWDELLQDLKLIGLKAKKAKSLYWYTCINERLRQHPPLAEDIKPTTGVFIHRLGQVSFRKYEKTWFFGVPPQYFKGLQTGDFWFSENERNQLSLEFSALSSKTQRQEMKQSILSAMALSKESIFLDAKYDWDGRERESLKLFLLELGLLNTETLASQNLPKEKGAFPLFIDSYQKMTKAPQSSFTLKPIGELSPVAISASALDYYSRCAFMALGASRWKMRDLRSPREEPWGETKGRILHLTVKLLIEERGDSIFTETPTDISEVLKSYLDRAWVLESPRGMWFNPVIYEKVKKKYFKILCEFYEHEKKYRKNSQAKTYSLEGPELRLEHPNFVITGVPDRIDENQHGLFIIDYKTTSMLPTGQDMILDGYRLQLPFYAVALKNLLKKNVAGVQFVELNRHHQRNKGVFFQAYNGKEAFSFTNLRSQLNIFTSDPDVIWSKAQKQIEFHANNYAQGVFELNPKKENECRVCAFSDLCGVRRMQKDGNI
ncbi:MAG: PD-(D/E)XK nuclease family protein [Bdellovibrio sp.]|nr:PD-(D/E)XK nuclease family protein [Bdellovibrio sp.]